MWSFILASVLALSLVTAEEIVTVCRNTYGRSDFLIQVIPLTSASAKRQESAYSGYLDQSGSILRDCRQGSTWRLANAQLSSNGLKVSVSKSTASARFETSLILGVESTKFATSSDFLFWDNVAFDSGTARFCASVGSSGALTAVFKGHIPHDCVPVTLRTVPVFSCNKSIAPSLSSVTISASSFSGNSTPFVTNLGSTKVRISSPAASLNTSKTTSVNFESFHSSNVVVQSSEYITSHALGTGTQHTSAVASNSSTTVGAPSSSYTGLPSFSYGHGYGSLGHSPSGSAFTPAISSLATISQNSLSDLGKPSSVMPSIVGITISSENSSVPASSTTSHAVNSSAQVSSTTSHTINSSIRASFTVSNAFNSSIQATSTISNVFNSTSSQISQRPSISMPANSTISSPMSATSTRTASYPSNSSIFNSTLISRSVSKFPTSSSFPSSSSKRPASHSFSASILTANSTFRSTINIRSSSTSASKSPSIPPLRLASSVIGADPRYFTWCSSYLGYDNVTSRATATIEATIRLTTTTIIIPPTETTVETIYSTKASTLVTPSGTTIVYTTPFTNISETVTATDTVISTVTTTATTEDFSQIIQKRQAVNSTSVVSTPSALQSFEPSIISNACSANVRSPSANPPATVTETLTNIHTQEVTAAQKHRTIDVISELDVGITIESGQHRITETAGTKTYKYTTIETITRTLDSTATATKTNTVPTVILAHPTAIVGSIKGSKMDYDDFAYPLNTTTIPFEMQMYGSSTKSIWVSTNGLLSLYTGSWYYNNAPLPRVLPVPNLCLFPLWDDTFIYSGQPQGIYYEITGAGNGSKITFEFYLSHYHGMTQYYHYTVAYDSADPGVYVIKYYQVSDNGTSATVGMQDYDANKFTQFSYNSPVIHPGLELTLNTNTGIISQSSFDVSGDATSDTS